MDFQSVIDNHQPIWMASEVLGRPLKVEIPAFAQDGSVFWVKKGGGHMRIAKCELFSETESGAWEILAQIYRKKTTYASRKAIKTKREEETVRSLWLNRNRWNRKWKPRHSARLQEMIDMGVLPFHAVIKRPPVDLEEILKAGNFSFEYSVEGSDPDNPVEDE